MLDSFSVMKRSNAKEQFDIEEFIENPIFNFSLRPHDSGSFVITVEETSPGRLSEWEDEVFEWTADTFVILPVK